MRTTGMGLMLSIVVCLASQVVADETVSPCGSTGTVVSTEDSAGYTYVQLNVGGSTVWYAIPAAEFKAGERVIAPAGLPMKDFYSKTLNRTFDLVYFSDGISRIGEETKAGNLPAGHPPISTSLPAGHPAIAGSLPPGHPPISTSTNSACCTWTNEPAACCAGTNSVAQ